MPILNIHAGSLPSFSLRMKQSDNLESIRQRSASKIRLDLRDGIPLIVKYSHQGQTFSLEDGETEPSRGEKTSGALTTIIISRQTTTGTSLSSVSATKRRSTVSEELH